MAETGMQMAVMLLKRLGWFCAGSFLLIQVAIAESESSNYNQGITAYKEGHFQQAFAAWSLAAYEGNTEAQYNLGVLYLEGLGIGRNLEQARTWFVRAAEKDHIEAQYNLGHMALSGMATEKSIEQALQWWEGSARGGYAPAQFNYGRALYLGVSGKLDKSAGLEFIQRAAAQKDSRAMKFLAENIEPVASLEGSRQVETKADIAQLDEAFKGEVTQSEQVLDVGDQESNGEDSLSNVELARAATSVDSQSAAVPEAISAAEEPASEAGLVAGNVELEPVSGTDVDVERADTPAASPEAGWSTAQVSKKPEESTDNGAQRSKPPLETLNTVEVLDKTEQLNPNATDEIGLDEGHASALAKPTTQLTGDIPERDVQIVQKSYLMRTVNRPVTMYSGPDMHTPVAELGPVSLVRVRGILGNKLQIEVSAGSAQRNWILADDLAYSGESAQQLQEAWKEMPGDPDLPGELAISSQLKEVAPVIADDKVPNEKDTKSTRDSMGARLNDNRWLFVQEENTFVIKLFSIRNHEKAAMIANEPRFRDRGHLYTTLVKGEPWSFLLLGPYSDRTAAETALGQLPVHHRNGAQLNRVSSIAQKRCDKRETLLRDQAAGLDAYCLD